MKRTLLIIKFFGRLSSLFFLTKLNPRKKTTLAENDKITKQDTKIAEVLKFESIYHEISQISFIKKYVNIFGKEKYKELACIKTMRKEIQQRFNEKLLAPDSNDPTFEARKYSINVERAENIDALESINEHKKIIKNANFLILIEIHKFCCKVLCNCYLGKETRIKCLNKLWEKYYSPGLIFKDTFQIFKYNFMYAGAYKVG